MRTGWLLLLAPLLLLPPAAADDDDPPPIVGHYETKTGLVIDLAEAKPGPRMVNLSEGTLKIGPRVRACSLWLDDYGNWVFSCGDLECFTPVFLAQDRGGFTLQQGPTKEPFRRVAPPAGYQPPKAQRHTLLSFDRPLKQGDVVEVELYLQEVSFEPGAVPLQRLVYLERIAALEDGRVTKVERHVTEDHGGRPSTKGRTFVLTRSAPGVWSVAAGQGQAAPSALETRVMAFSPPADPAVWRHPPRPTETRLYDFDLRPGQLPPGAPEVVLAIVRGFDAEAKAAGGTKGTWQAGGESHRRSCRVMFELGTAHKDFDFSQTLRSAPLPFPGAAPAPAAAPPTAPARTPEPAPTGPLPEGGPWRPLPGVEDGTIREALGRARAGKRLLVVAFLGLDGWPAEGERKRTAEALAQLGPLAERFLVVRRPRLDAKGAATEEASSYLAAFDLTYVVIDPWSSLIDMGEPYTTLAVLSDAGRLPKRLERALRDAAAEGHPPGAAALPPAKPETEAEAPPGAAPAASSEPAEIPLAAGAPDGTRERPFPMALGQWAPIRLEALARPGPGAVVQVWYSIQTTRGDCMVELHLQRSGRDLPVEWPSIQLHDSRGRRIGWCLTGGERFGPRKEDSSATRFAIRDGGRFLVSITLSAAQHAQALRTAGGRTPQLGWQLDERELRDTIPRPAAPAPGMGTRERPITIQLAKWVDGLIVPRPPAAPGKDAVVFERWYQVTLPAGCEVELCQDRDPRLVTIIWDRNLALLDPRGAVVTFETGGACLSFDGVPGTHSAEAMGVELRQAGTYLVRVRIHHGDLEELHKQPPVELQYRIGVGVRKR